MFKLKTLSLAILCLLFLMPGYFPRVTARQLSQWDSYFDRMPAAERVYAQWRDETFGKAADSVPHYALSTVLSRINQKTVALAFAAVGQSVEGALLEIRPGRISRNGRGKTEFQSLIEQIDISVHSYNQMEVLNPIGQARVTLPAYDGVNGYEIKYSFRREAGAEKRSITVLIPLSEEVHSATSGAVFAADYQSRQADQGTKSGSGGEADGAAGESLGDPGFEWEMRCLPGCNFFSISGPNCSKEVCCIDTAPYMDLTTCTVLCWTQCWMPN